MAHKCISCERHIANKWKYKRCLYCQLATKSGKD